MRIEEHPILGEYKKGKKVKFSLMVKNWKDSKENQLQRR